MCVCVCVCMCVCVLLRCSCVFIKVPDAGIYIGGRGSGEGNLRTLSAEITTASVEMHFELPLKFSCD